MAVFLITSVIALGVIVGMAAYISMVINDEM